MGFGISITKVQYNAMALIRSVELSNFQNSHNSECFSFIVLLILKEPQQKEGDKTPAFHVTLHFTL